MALIRRGLACVLIGALIILAQLAVSHLHGISDPHRAHSLDDYILLAQARSGFAAASIALLIVLLALFCGPGPTFAVRAACQVFSSYCVRAPPQFV